MMHSNYIFKNILLALIGLGFIIATYYMLFVLDFSQPTPPQQQQETEKQSPQQKTESKSSDDNPNNENYNSNDFVSEVLQEDTNDINQDDALNQNPLGTLPHPQDTLNQDINDNDTIPDTLNDTETDINDTETDINDTETDINDTETDINDTETDINDTATDINDTETNDTKTTKKEKSDKDLSDDPEALLDEITEQINTDNLTIKEKQLSSEKNNDLDTIRELAKEKTSKDLFSAIDSQNNLTEKNKNDVIDYEPTNDGIDASTTPTAIDNDTLLQASDDSFDTVDTEFSDDINDLSLRDMKNPLDEESSNIDDVDAQLNDNKQTSNNNNNIDEQIALPESPEMISRTSDAQTKETGIIPTLSPKEQQEVADLYQMPNEKNDTTDKTKKTTKPKLNINFDNQNFVCHFIEDVDSVKQQQGYKLMIAPENDPDNPIILTANHKMELHQFFDAAHNIETKTQVAFSILKHFCKKMIVKKSITETY